MVDKRISELDVLDFLTERRELLEGELKKIDSTIAVLKSSTQALVGIHAIGQDLKSAQSVRKSEKAVADRNNAPTYDIPTQYNPSDSFDKRILFVLSTLGKGNRDNILDEIRKHEREEDFKKIEGNVKVRLSHLLKNGVIKGKRNGRLYTYSLK